MVQRLLITTLLFCLTTNSFSQSNTKGVSRLENQDHNSIASKAIIVGISDYMNVQPLNYAHTDALSFYSYLVSDAGGNLDSSKIILLLNEKATAANIYGALDWLVDEATKDDKVIIYFSGHGDLETKTMRQNGFLLGYDSPEHCYMAGGTIGVKYLQDYLETIAQNNKSKIVLITDACRSGKLAGGSEGAKNTTAALAENWQSIIKVLSSQPGELSLEGDKWGNGAGVFTYYLINGLTGLADRNNDFKVSGIELYSYLIENIPRETQFTQNPSINGNMNSTLSYVDSVSLALLKVNINEGNTELLAYKGMDDHLKKNIDEETYNQYELFNNCIKEDNLIPDEYNPINAWDLYNELKDNPEAAMLIKKMNRTLLAALQNKSQIFLNEYLKGREDELEFDFFEARNEYEYAFKLVDSTHILYNQMLAKHLLFQSTKAIPNNKKIELLEKAIEIEPNAAYIYNTLGVKYSNIDKKPLALVTYLKAIELAPNWPYPHYNLGILYYDIDSNNLAIKSYLNAIKADNEYSSAYNNLGTVYDKIEEYDKAIESYEAAIKINNEYALPYFNLGVTYSDLKNYDKSIEYYLKAIEIKPDYADAYNNLGIRYNYKEEYDKSIKSYLKAIEIKPDYTLAYNNLGASYNDNKEYDKAIIAYKKAIELDSTYVDAYINLGICYVDMEEYQEAINAYKKASELDPGNDNVLCHIGNSYRISDSLQYAIIAYLKAININKENKNAYNGLGITYRRLGKYEQAIEAYKKAIEIRPDYVDTYNNLGYAYHQYGLDSLAILSYLKAIEIKPEYALAYENLGDVYYEKGENLKGIEIYKQALNVDSSHNSVLFNIGNAYYSLYNYDSAIYYFKDYLNYYPTSKYSLFNIGLSYKILENYDSAILYHKKNIRAYPDYIRPYQDLASLYRNNVKEYDSALKYLNYAIKIDPDDAANYENLAYTYLRLEKKSEALKYFKKAIDANPDFAWYYYDICCYYSLEGNLKKSIKWFEQALQKGFDNFDHLETDSDIDFIRNTQEYKKLIDKYKK